MFSNRLQDRDITPSVDVRRSLQYSFSSSFLPKHPHASSSWSPVLTSKNKKRFKMTNTWPRVSVVSQSKEGSQLSINFSSTWYTCAKSITCRCFSLSFLTCIFLTCMNHKRLLHRKRNMLYLHKQNRIDFDGLNFFCGSWCCCWVSVVWLVLKWQGSSFESRM